MAPLIVEGRLANPISPDILNAEDARALTLGRELLRIWEDQAAFNLLFRSQPTNAMLMAEQVRQFVLYTESELHELLRTMGWKQHRKQTWQDNRPHRFEEAADIFKCTLSLFQIIGMTPEELIKAYWRKTKVVRARYEEEWIRRIDDDARLAVVDIDNCIADYAAGMCDWLINVPNTIDLAVLLRIKEEKTWITAQSLGISDEEWKELKHAFRTSGAKRHLPIFDDAKLFLDRLRIFGFTIVLLTSRPIDRYPNLYTDTLLWLQKHDLPFDYIWWGFDKSEVILERELRSRIQFVVDDDFRYVEAFANLGIQSYWLKRPPSQFALGKLADLGKHTCPITSLSAIDLEASRG